jgi:hypothetical protein
VSAKHRSARSSDMDRPTTLKEKARITAGAVASLVIVAWLIVLAIAFLSAR